MPGGAPVPFYRVNRVMMTTNIQATQKNNLQDVAECRTLLTLDTSPSLLPLEPRRVQERALLF
jgi:hypothetical protein